MKKQLMLNEKFMLFIVLLNVVVIFLQGCGLDNIILATIDVICTILFVLEMVAKHRAYGFRGYWTDGWNAFDGVVTLVTLPALLIYHFLDPQTEHTGRTSLPRICLWVSVFRAGGRG